MNPVQLPFLVEAILITATMLLGFLLRKSEKPYGKLKLVAHIFFYLWFTTGYGFIASSLWASGSGIATWLLVGLMGLLILVQLGTGIAMMIARIPGKTLPKVHLVAAFALLFADIGAFVGAGISR